MDSSLKLISIKFHETKDDDIVNDTPEFKLSDFNLLIGDNAQGKSRFIKTLNYVANAIAGKAPRIATHFNAIFTFKNINKDKAEKVEYYFESKPTADKTHFFENIKRGNKTIFSTKKRILVNERQKKTIGDFFIPENLPAISSINQKDYVTINLIKTFFSRMMTITAAKNSLVSLSSSTQLKPNKEGANLSSVLYNWSEQFPDRYYEVIKEFHRNFTFTENIGFIDGPLEITDIKTKLLSFDEKNVFEKINQLNWSDGMHRALHILMSVQCPYKSRTKTEYPSLILIDEIENGLDFKTLTNIINYLKDYSDESQILITSHSPLVCEMVHPKNWLVVKRKGYKVEFKAPKELETDIRNSLDIFKQKHWDFYTKHISNSGQYSVNE